MSRIITMILVFSFALGSLAKPKLDYEGPYRNPYLFSHRAFYTINPNYVANGPLLDAGNTKEYVQNIFGKIIHQADLFARGRWLLKRENYTYWSFILGSLLVPYHESKLMHFRKATRCNDTANSLVELAKLPDSIENEKVRKKVKISIDKFIKNQFKEQYEPLIPNCKNLADQDKLTQVYASRDHVGLGIMQLNARYHQDGLIKEVYLNLKETIKYGLDIYYKSFIYLRGNFEKYDCLNVGLGELTYSNLIRGAWSGKYNSGSYEIDKVCRFKMSEQNKGRWQGNDKHFTQNFLSLIKNGDSIYHKYLPEGSIERNAFFEVLRNFKLVQKEVGKDSSLNFDLVREKAKAKGYDVYGENTEFAQPKYDPQFYVNVKKVNFRNQPSIKSSRCGYLERINDEIIHLKVLEFKESLEEKSSRTWAKVKIPDYALFAHHSFKDINCKGLNGIYYISKNLLKEFGDIEFIAVGKTKPKSVNVREKHIKSGTPLSVLSKGTEVKIVSKYIPSGGSFPTWYEIEMPVGFSTTGWVSAKQVEIVNEK